MENVILSSFFRLIHEPILIVSPKYQLHRRYLCMGSSIWFPAENCRWMIHRVRNWNAIPLRIFPRRNSIMLERLDFGNIFTRERNWSGHIIQDNGARKTSMTQLVAQQITAFINFCAFPVLSSTVSHEICCIGLSLSNILSMEALRVI